MPTFIEMPFIFKAAEFWPRRGSRAMPHDSEILNFLSAVDGGFDKREFLDRYKELVDLDGRVDSAPDNPKMLQRIVNPLKFAKINYLLGNYLGTIIHVGMVAEMLVLFMIRLAKTMFETGQWPRNLEEPSFDQFDKLRQSERLIVLQSAGIMTEAFAKGFAELANIRNKYLHRYEADHAEVRSDALKAYGVGIRLFLATIGQRIEGSLLDGWEKGAEVTVYPCSEIVWDYLTLEQDETK